MTSKVGRSIAGVVAILTCPCHIVLLILILGGTTGAAWLSKYLPVLSIILGVVFVVSLWFLLRRPKQPSEIQ